MEAAQIGGPPELDSLRQCKECSKLKQSSEFQHFKKNGKQNKDHKYMNVCEACFPAKRTYYYKLNFEGHGKTRLSDEVPGGKVAISEQRACKFVFAACEEAVAVTERKLHAQAKLGSLRKFSYAVVLWNSNKKPGNMIYVSSNDAGVSAATGAVGQCISSLREQEPTSQPSGSRLQESLLEMERLRRRHEAEMRIASENVRSAAEELSIRCKSLEVVRAQPSVSESHVTHIAKKAKVPLVPANVL